MALPGGPGQTNVRYVDTVVTTYGPSRTVVTRRDKRGNTLYVYRTIYRHITAPAAPGEGRLGGPRGSSGGGPSGGNRGADSADAARRARAAARAARLARQAAKRAAAAQRARSIEAAQMRTLKASNAAAQAQRQMAEARRRVQSISAVEQVRVEESNRRHRDELRTRAVSAVLHTSADQGRTALRAYSQARRFPGLASHLRIEDLARIITDPASPFDPRRAADARIVQRFLRGHGHDVEVDGVFGETTNAALAQEFEKAARREAARQRELLKDTYYESGILKAGAKAPDWWPLFNKIVPTPGELLKLLEAGGFTASVLLRGLTAQANQPHLMFLNWREEQIRRLGRAFYGHLADPLAPLFGPMDETLMMARVAGVRELQTPQGRAMVKALYRSHDFEEFQRNLQVLERQEEAAYRREQMEAAGDRAWWQEALHQINRPVEWFTTWATAMNERIEENSEELRAALKEGDLKKAFLEDQIGSLRFSDEEWAAAEAQFNSLPVWQQITFEIVLDPLNFIPGLGTVSRFGTRGALALERSGIRIAASQSTFAAHFVGQGGSVERLIAAHSLMAPAHVLRSISQMQHRTMQALRAGRNPIVRYTPLGPAYNAAVKATQLKQVAVSNARAGLEFAARHGFRQVAKVAGRDLPDTYSKRISSATRDLLDKSHVELKARIPSVMGELVEALRRNNISLFVDAGRQTPSTVGARLLGRVNAEFRVQALQRLALESARDAFAAARDSGLTRAEAAVKEIEEYRRVIREGGFFGKGGGDPEIERELAKRVAHLSDTWELAIFPVLQDILEEMAEGAGLKLFDEETLLWIGRHGEADEALRALNLHAFDPDNLVKVANPRFNVPVPYHVAEDLVSAEIRVQRYQVIANFARREAAGDTVDAERLGRRLKEIEEEAWGHWKQTPEGWVDTREFLEVPSFHSRHIQEAYDEALKVNDISKLGGVGSLSAIALPPGQAARTAMDNQIGAVAWHLGGGHLLEDGDAALDSLLRDFRPDLGSRRVAGSFKAAVHNRKFAVAAAWDEAQPFALRKEWALWQAMAEAQSRPMKLLYNTLHGALSVWIFATLPLRPGWVVRNVVDNAAKVFIDGARDPRYYFLGAAKPGAKVRSVFEADVRAMIGMAEAFDRVFKTSVADSFRAIIESFFNHSAEVVNRIFRAHAMPPVPEKVLNDARMDIPLRRERVPRPFEQADEAGSSWVARWKEGIWELMASKPENYFKRIRFRAEYVKGVESGLDEIAAYRKAWESVERTLFDYSKVTVTEDNLRMIFPFVQFWRKNTAFWVRNFANRPWLPAQIALAEDNLREELHGDWPEWMRRYLHAKELQDATASVPGLGWLAKHLDQDVMSDPMNFFSFAPLYRAWKGEGIFGDEQASGPLAFLSPFLDAMEDWGLGFTPFLRWPMEQAGLLTPRAWQTIFPQTPLAVALTRKYLGDRWANRIIDIEALVGLDFRFDKSKDVQQQFEDWVNLEMLNQAKRGEPVSREKAIETIQDYYIFQTALGYFAGAYVRRMTPEDFYLYQLSDKTERDDWDDLSAEDRALLTFFRQRKGVESVWFERYLDNLPLVEGYYRQTSYEAAEEYKRENPSILPYVEPAFRGKPFSSRYVQTAALITQTEAAMKLFDLVDKLDIDQETAELATSLLVTPELEAFWAKNDTPAERRQKMLRGQYYAYLGQLQDAFHAIPEKDFDAREGFLAEHPELQRFWEQGNSRSDDYAAILHHVHADLRDRYFELVEAGDWDSANAFLSAFPFIFDKIEDDRYILDRQTGRGGSSGGMSQHARDYLKARRWLDYFFSLPEAARAAWLNGNTEGARVVRWYFAKYAHDGSVGGQTAHARDYLAAKRWLDHYFSLPQERRSAWLRGGSEGAKVVLDYFKKYGRTNRMARSFGSNSALLGSRNPELAKRLQFWSIYFSLPASDRPLYVMRNAAKFGIFVYGIFGARERAAREAAFLRRAYAAGLSPKAAHYLYVKPLLDFFFTLGKKEKTLFLRANPEVQAYLDSFSDKTVTGNKKLDRLIEAYFKLPDNSPARSQYLQRHPQVQDYFDSISSPAERAMHRLLEVYFNLPSLERQRFLQRHPEIQDYFDKRQLERRREQEQFEAFDQADPRLAPYWAAGKDSTGASAERILNFLSGQKAGRLAGDTLETRTERRPASS